MDPIIGGALIGGAANLLGGLFGRSGQSSANAANLKIAREQMAFQERMSNTEYQRSVADLKAAGINPMLGVMKGGGASTPSGASAHMENPNASVSEGLSSAGAIAAQIGVLKAQARKLNTETDIIAQSVPYSAQNAFVEADRLDSQAIHAANELRSQLQGQRLQELDIEQKEKMNKLLLDLQRIENERARLGLPESRAMSEFWDSEFGRNIAPYLKHGGGSVSGAVIGGGAALAGRLVGRKLATARAGARAAKGVGEPRRGVYPGKRRLERDAKGRFIKGRIPPRPANPKHPEYWE